VQRLWQLEMHDLSPQPGCCDHSSAMADVRKGSSCHCGNGGNGRKLDSRAAVIALFIGPQCDLAPCPTKELAVNSKACHRWGAVRGIRGDGE
jgi:hypothetical protein